MEANEVENENTLLQNSLLFNVIRKNKKPEEKLHKISKYLRFGADINAVDANNKLNTPLQVAVLKGEVEVVSYLLSRGANTIVRNKDSQTALDIALQRNTNKDSEIANIIKSRRVENQAHDVEKESDVLKLNLKIKQKDKVHVHNPPRAQASKSVEEHFYQKRSETSGLGGQLYETKLVTLVLLRASYSDRIKNFFLGTNVDGIGAFDDIIFRYDMKGRNKSKIIFLQAKHRENPTKDEITVEEVLKQNGDFSLIKYLDSYLKIISKFSHDNADSLFKGSIEDVDCEFIIFTSAFENFTKKKILVQNDEEDFIKTSENGKIFQYAYDSKDIDILVQIISRSRAVEVAKRLCQFIFKGNNNYKNMMLNNVIKSYHVFLAQNIITVEATSLNKSVDTFLIGKFREKFLNSNEDLLLLIKSTILKEIGANIKSSDNNPNKVNMQSLTFKLPVNFGNVNFSFKGSEIKKQKRLNYLCSKFQKLIQNGYEVDPKYILIKVNDNMVGPNKVLQDTDLENYRLGGLVGNLLFFDDKTNFLMFNPNEHNLSEDNLNLLDRLKNNLNDLSRFRFDFKLSQLPKLTLTDTVSDRNIVTTFLSRLKFYTNQAKEDEVETIVKEEIYKYCNIQQTKTKSLFRITCEAIFLKVHDKIQKWWKLSHRAPYLTADGKFYHEAQKDILDRPLLSFLDIVYRESMKSVLVKFSPVAIDYLKIENFLRRNEKTLVIYSNEINFSCIKLIQYFEGNEVDQSCLFIDLDFVITENYFEIVQSDLRKSKNEVLAVVLKNCSSLVKISETIKILSGSFKGKIILVTNSSLRDNLESVLSKDIIYELDNENSLNDVTSEYREIILIERKLLFQGDELSLDSILDSESLHFVRADVLNKIINKQKIEVGKTLTNPSYDLIENFYINQRLCRYITIDSKKETNDLYVIESLELDQLHVLQQSTDIILVTEYETEYDNVCKKYIERNVHWFRTKNKRFVWKKSRGSLKALVPYVSRESHKDYIITPRNLKDIKEKIVLISAEPGMGKSTLLTRLAIETKRMYPKIWVAKINLFEHIDLFNKWKEDHTNISDMVESIKFLCTVITTREENKKQGFQKLIDSIFVDDKNNVCIPNIGVRKELCNLDLLEINLFCHYYNNSSVALLLDGFDEICPDYTDEVMTLLSTLKTSKVALLWVTSRSHNMLSQLECVLETFSFALQPLTKAEQKTFLERILSSKLGLDDAVQTRGAVEIFFHFIEDFLNDYNWSFTSFPLHLNMFSERFLDCFKYCSDEKIEISTEDFCVIMKEKMFNLISLYETFVDMKFFEIRFGDKKHCMSFKDPDMRKVVEKERKVFLDNHKKNSAYFLLPKSVVTEMFSEEEITEVYEFIEHIRSGEEKSGIIESIVGDVPKFVHITFAKYFAAEFLNEKFQSGSCSTTSQTYIVTVIRDTDDGVYKFLISRFREDKNILASLFDD